MGGEEWLKGFTKRWWGSVVRGRRVESREFEVQNEYTGR